jgi:hypothetical protein
MRCQLVHAIPGRLRIRVASSAAFDRAATLQAYLEGQPGILSVRLNPACRCVILTHDPGVAAEVLLALLAGLSPQQLRGMVCPPARAQPPQPGALLGLPLALSTAAAAAALGGGSALASWLLAGAAVPVFQRAFAVLFRKAKLNVLTLCGLTGQIATTLISNGAALLATLNALRPLINDETEKQWRTMNVPRPTGLLLPARTSAPKSGSASRRPHC